MKKQLTFGVIVGSRGFFPHHLAKEGRDEIIKVLGTAGYKIVVLSPEQTQHGAVQTPDDARHCAELFKRHREEIDGIIVTLPNFGEERAIVDAIRSSQYLKLVGLMTVPPWSEDAELSRPYFQRLAALARAHHLAHLSMGMSNDFEVAIEEGATIIRVGTALFGPRPKPL